MTKYVKLIDETIEEAPINYGNWINFNQDENLMKAEGYKPLRLAEREENHYYTSEYEEHDDYIQEKLNDITRQVVTREKIEYLQQLKGQYKHQYYMIYAIDEIIDGLEKILE